MNRYGGARCVAAVAVGALVAGHAVAGSLDPAAAPGPTMHTLEDIYQQVTSIAAAVATNRAPVAKTGQMSSYAGGDDGDLEPGVAWPSPRFTVDGTGSNVTDNLTGLMWAQDANMDGLKAWATAVAYCTNLTWGGYSDWRLPNVKELESLQAWQYVNPCVPNTAGTGQWSAGDPFNNVQSLLYWTSTTHAGSGSWAWHVGLGDGAVDPATKDKTRYVWPVRGGD